MNLYLRKKTSRFLNKNFNAVRNVDELEINTKISFYVQEKIQKFGVDDKFNKI